MLNEIMTKIVDVKSYIDIIEEVADATNNYKLVDKIHYLVNEKLGIESDVCAVCESGLSNHVTYCKCCGEYLHHNNMYREAWYVQVGKDNFLIHFTPWVDDDYDKELCISCQNKYEYFEEYEDDAEEDYEESELDAYLSDMSDAYEDVDDDDLPF